MRLAAPAAPGRQHSVKPAGGRLRTGSPMQRRGAAAEDLACAFLQRHGLRIIARNVRYARGETDAVAREGPVWVFVEVRSRARRGDAAASIDWRKRGRIRRAAQLFLLGRFGDRWPACRFDVVLVADDGIRWLRSAFLGDEER
jgi:putative endonuclease